MLRVFRQICSSGKDIWDDCKCWLPAANLTELLKYQCENGEGIKMLDD